MSEILAEFGLYDDIADIGDTYTQNITLFFVFIIIVISALVPFVA